MKHVWVAVDQSPVETHGEALVLAVTRKRKTAMSACEAQYARLGIDRKPRWAKEDDGRLYEVFFHHDSTDHYPGLMVEKRRLL